MRTLPLILLAVPAGSVLAQDTDIRTAVARAQPARYEQAACGIRTGHFKVGSGATYLSTAIRSEGNRDRLLRDAVNVLTEAITQNDQAGNPAAWYYMARSYLYQGDVVGADSAFARAETLAPQCREEIEGYRRTTSAALLAPAGLHLQAERTDSAIIAYRLAVLIHPAGTQASYTLATVYESAGQPDSAIAYFRRAVHAGAPADDRYVTLARTRLASVLGAAGQVDSAVVYYRQAIAAAETASDQDGRNRATFALALLLYNAQRYPEAIPVLRRYIEWRPDFPAARQMLANAFRATGQVDSAEAVMRALGAATGAAGPDTTSATYLIGRGASRYQSGDYENAAIDFAAAVAAEPYNHTAIRNLAITYYQLKDGTKLAEAAGRLVDLEPLSESARRLQNQAYIWLNDQAKLGPLSQALDAMPVSLEDVKITATGMGATASGTAKGRGAGQRPVTIVFEFLDGGGNVVAATEVAIPGLADGATHALSAEGSGGGIMSWRYRVK